MIDEEKLLSLIKKEKKTRNRIKREYEEKYEVNVHPYLLKYLLEKLEREGKIKSEKGGGGWVTYYWR